MIRVLYILLSFTVSVQSHGSREDYINHGAEHVKINIPRQFFVENINWRRSVEMNNQLKNKCDESTDNYMSFSRAENSLVNTEKLDIYAYEHWFYGMTNGVVVESGAFDGLQFSVSHFFENFANWTSILIEADILNFRRLRDNRLKSISVNCALCDKPNVYHYVPLKGTTGGIYEFMEPDYIKSWQPQIDMNDPHFIDKLIPIQCITFMSLMNLLSIKHINLWILDVEGAEEVILKSINFNEIQIDAIIMETAWSTESKNRNKVNFLIENGYKCTQLKDDAMCIHHSFHPSSKY
jgi:hypothetical protein